MAADDFDLATLAQYLHLSEQQVLKLVERGGLPGRRVGGQWRFSQAEIHHWLEDRIGASDSAELVSVESALHRSAARSGEESVSIGELLLPEAVAVPLAARTRSSVITEMAQLAAHTGYLWDASRLADAVRERENLHPTALDNGVALLHPRRPLAGILGQPLVALGITRGGIPFGGAQGRLTDVFFLLCSTDDRGHLRTLARLSRLIADADLLAELRAAPDAFSARELLVTHEAALTE